MPKNNQLDRFKAAAKETGADMSEADFQKVVGKLAKAPKPEQPKAKKTRARSKK